MISKKNPVLVAPIPGQNFPISVLLVDDQPIVAEAVRRMVQDQSDITVHYTSNPSEVIQTAIQVRPTVILQDLVMPDVDGLMLVRYLRANAVTCDVPLMVLSSKEEPLVKAEAFALGANDYMVKLPDRIEFIARIRYHSAAYIRLLERNLAYKKLEESQRALNAELAEAATYIRSLLPRPLDDSIKTLWRFIPSAQLGGDALGYQWIGKNHFVFFLIDVCGHGIGAALLSISIMNVLRSQSFLHVNFLEPDKVLAALNANFPMEAHNEMFFTMWYGAYNKQKRELIYSSGGHPPAICAKVDKGGAKRLIELRTDGPVIGATSIAQFHCNSYPIAEEERLYLFSDGLYELAKPDGTVLQLEEFVKEIAKPKQEGVEEIDRILDFSRSLMGARPFADDVSILEITFK
jgi:sigma-B regulation protein RsbU (phosphoserine phosphatase)